MRCRFYDAILHELGHVHGLGHINDKKSLMYFNTVKGQRVNITTGSTYPGPASLLGGLDMVKTSIANSPSSLGCGSYSILVQSSINCTDPHLGVPVVSNSAYNLNLYPNPANNGNIIISYELNKNSFIQFKILDYSGREVMILNDEKKSIGTYTEQVNIDDLANGVYLFKANINGECKTIKFIKL